MGPTWVLSAPDGPHVGPMNLALWVDMDFKITSLLSQPHTPGVNELTASFPTETLAEWSYNRETVRSVFYLLYHFNKQALLQSRQLQFK